VNAGRSFGTSITVRLGLGPSLGTAKHIVELNGPVGAIGTFLEASLRKLLKRFLGFELSTTAAREITDALVIFSTCMILYHLAITEWDGSSIIDRVLGSADTPSFVYFVGVALVVFSIRRIIDQRSERIRRVAAEERAHELSIRDPLTQLPNRHQFEFEASAKLKRPNNRMTVLLVGLSQFKKLHDMYGHLGCDAALLQVAKRLRNRLEPDNLFARIGDDEFALSLSHVDPEIAGKIAMSLVEDVKQPVQIGIEHVSISANVV
jgi:diguanylate cyclase (GGDEF)-like protein